MMPTMPSFDAFSGLPGSGLRHAWDVWGPGDNLGTLNRLTGPVVAAAAATCGPACGSACRCRSGCPTRRFSGGRGSSTLRADGPPAWDDWLDGFYLQCSSQWDGLRHIGSGPTAGTAAGGASRPPTLSRSASTTGRSGGIIGRGVLADLASSAVETRPGGYAPFNRVAFRPRRPRGRAGGARHRAEVGDILCVRTGWGGQLPGA